MSLQSQRLANVNAFIQVIANNGRRFFYNEKHDRYASMLLDDNARVWFIDDYTNKPIYTHFTSGRWKGFTHGGTLRSLVCFFRDHIKKGTLMPASYFTPNPIVGGQHIWGYPEESLVILKEEGIRLGIIDERKVS